MSIITSKGIAAVKAPINQLVLKEPKNIILVTDPDYSDVIFFFFFGCETLNPFPQGSVPTSNQRFIRRLLPELHHGTGQVPGVCNAVVGVTAFRVPGIATTLPW